MSESEQKSQISNTNDSLFESNFSEQPVNTSSQGGFEAASSNNSSNNQNNNNNENRQSLSVEELNNTTITLRSLVTSKEAGVIIGKNGKNVADLREQTGVKAGVSKSVDGVQDRVLTVTGTLAGVAQAYSIAAATLLESPIAHTSTITHTPTPAGLAVIRLLISHHQMGTIIGRQGSKIKAIQEESKVRMVASKELLHNSTERTVEVQGKPESIKSAIWEIGRCLIEDSDRNTNTIFYVPQSRSSFTSNNGYQNNRYNNGYHNNGQNMNRNNFRSNYDDPNKARTVSEEMSISADMVGCIIGRKGSKIAEIRRESGAQISIAKEPHDNTGERMFTITGTPDANQKALTLLFNQLEFEKKRRTEANEAEKVDA